MILSTSLMFDLLKYERAVFQKIRHKDHIRIAEIHVSAVT
jgi:hypothetical protein